MIHLIKSAPSSLQMTISGLIMSWGESNILHYSHKTLLQTLEETNLDHSTSFYYFVGLKFVVNVIRLSSPTSKICIYLDSNFSFA